MPWPAVERTIFKLFSEGLKKRVEGQEKKKGIETNQEA